MAATSLSHSEVVLGAYYHRTARLIAGRGCGGIRTAIRESRIKSVTAQDQRTRPSTRADHHVTIRYSGEEVIGQRRENQSRTTPRPTARWRLCWGTGGWPRSAASACDGREGRR